MSNFASKKTRELTLKNGETVTLREQLSFGEVQEINNIMVSNKEIKLLQMLIVDWDFKDDEGNKVNYSPEKVSELSLEAVSQIVEVAQTILSSILDESTDKKK